MAFIASMHSRLLVASKVIFGDNRSDIGHAFDQIGEYVCLHQDRRRRRALVKTTNKPTSSKAELSGSGTCAKLKV